MYVCLHVEENGIGFDNVKNKLS